MVVTWGWGRAAGLKWVRARDAAQHPTVPRTTLVSAVLRRNS